MENNIKKFQQLKKLESEAFKKLQLLSAKKNSENYKKALKNWNNIFNELINFWKGQ